MDLRLCVKETSSYRALGRTRGSQQAAQLEISRGEFADRKARVGVVWVVHASKICLNPHRAPELLRTGRHLDDYLAALIICHFLGSSK